MSTISSTTTTTTAAVKTPDARITGDVHAATSSATSEPEKQQPSVSLTLSDYSQKRMKIMREAGAKFRAMQAKQQELRKEAARQRLEDIKRRIEMLKQLVMALGPAAAKGALRQIKQLAQELGAAASVLKEPSGGGTATVNAGAAQPSKGSNEAAATEIATAVEAPSEVPPEVEPDPDAQVAASAASEQASAEEGDAEADADGNGKQTETVMERVRNDRDDRQRRADAEELKKVAGQLKQLLAMVKAQFTGKPDKESEKLLDDIDRQLAEVEQTTIDMGAGSVSISVGSMVSVSV